MSAKKTSSNVERGKTPQPTQLPAFLEGPVVKGFGRGSKELGCPTANIPIEPYEELLKTLPLGVYYGWASVARGPVYKAAINIGWSPFYKNTQRTVEGYIRPEWDFTSLDELKKAIQGDITYAEQRLDRFEPAVAAFFAKEDSKM